jgi:hypothetical protein
MLLHLRALHTVILRRLDELDKLTTLPEPPMDRLPAVRLALSRASRARTLFIDRHHRMILEAAPAHRRAAIIALKQDMAAQMDASATHIGKWTIDAIVEAWPQYCSASATMRGTMRRRISAEASVLYPVLSALPLTNSVG